MEGLTMKLKTIVGVAVVAGMTMLMGVAANAATMLEFGNVSISGTTAQVPVYLESNEVKNFGTYDTDVTFDNTKMTFVNASNNIVDEFGDAFGAVTKDTSFIAKGEGRVGVLWLTSDYDTEFTDKVKLYTLRFKLTDTSMTADDILASLSVRPKELVSDGKIFSIGNFATYVTFTVDKDFVPTGNSKNIVGMALSVDGTQYSEADGTLKYNEDTDGNYVFTVKMKPSAKTVADVQLIGKVAKTEDVDATDSANTTDLLLKDFGTVQIENMTPFAD